VTEVKELAYLHWHYTVVSVSLFICLISHQQITLRQPNLVQELNFATARGRMLCGSKGHRSMSLNIKIILACSDFY